MGVCAGALLLVASATLVYMLSPATHPMDGYGATRAGAPIPACTPQGAVYVSVGPYSVWVVPIAPPTRDAWPERARDGWAIVPERELVTRLAEGSQAELVLPARHASVRRGPGARWLPS